MRYILHTGRHERTKRDSLPRSINRQTVIQRRDRDASHNIAQDTLAGSPVKKTTYFLMTLSRNATHTKQKYCIAIFVDIKTANNHALARNSCVFKRSTLHYMRPRHMRAICASFPHAQQSVRTHCHSVSRVQLCLEMLSASTSKLQLRLVVPLHLPKWRHLVCALEAIVPAPHLRLVEPFGQLHLQLCDASSFSAR